MLNVKEFIEYTGYDKQTVYAYLRQEKIKAERPTPDRYLISQEEADIWKAKKEAFDLKKKES